MLESAGGATFGASLAAAKRVTGRVVVYGTSGGEATVTNWELVYRHRVQVIGRPTAYDLADGPKALAELEARATVGKLALLP